MSEIGKPQARSYFAAAQALQVIGFINEDAALFAAAASILPMLERT